MGTLLLLDIPKVPSDSTIQELLKSVFGMLGIKNLTRLDSDHMCVYNICFVFSELETEKYHDIDRINARRDNVLRLWNYLLELLKARRSRLELSLQLQHNFQEMVYILDSMEELKLRLLSDDYGKHLLGVEDLLQKHSLVEADINVLGERVKQVVQQVIMMDTYF